MTDRPVLYLDFEELDRSLEGEGRAIAASQHRAASPSDLSRLRRLRRVASTIAGDLILVTAILSVIFVGAF